MRRYLFHTENGLLRLPLQGLTIDRCVVDHALAFEFFGKEGTTILRIEGAFGLTDHGVTLPLDPALPKDLGPAIGLFRSLVTSARVAQDGRLCIAFDGGREISVQPSDEYEAWELSAPGGLRAVCCVGGGVSTWGSSPTARPHR